jgi:hypothetical protein
MPIGSSKLGVLGAGLVPGGTETFNAPGTFSIPPGVKKVSITGVGGTGNPGLAGMLVMPGVQEPEAAEVREAEGGPKAMHPLTHRYQEPLAEMVAGQVAPMQQICQAPAFLPGALVEAVLGPRMMVNQEAHERP